MFFATSTVTEASVCYHHYNGDAWHNQGAAIVLCLNSGPEGDNDGMPMVGCQVRPHEETDVLTSFYPHGGLDHGRQVLTDPNIQLGRISVDIICTDKKGRTYSYPVPNAAAMTYSGTCSSDTGYVGSRELCNADYNYRLTVTKTGGKGSVTGSSKGMLTGKIDCQTNCTVQSTDYHSFSDKLVKLTATPAAGYSLVKWQGNCERVIGQDCYVNMDSDKTVTAVFGNKVKNVPVSRNMLLLGK